MSERGGGPGGWSATCRMRVRGICDGAARGEKRRAGGRVGRRGRVCRARSDFASRTRRASVATSPSERAAASSSSSSTSPSTGQGPRATMPRREHTQQVASSRPPPPVLSLFLLPPPGGPCPPFPPLPLPSTPPPHSPFACTALDVSPPTHCPSVIIRAPLSFRPAPSAALPACPPCSSKILTASPSPSASTSPSQSRGPRGPRPTPRRLRSPSPRSRRLCGTHSPPRGAHNCLLPRFPSLNSPSSLSPSLTASTRPRG